MTVDGWEFRRWQFDGAPLEAHRVARHRFDAAYSVEIDAAGDLVFDGLAEGEVPCVPPEVLRRLIADAVERRAPGWISVARGDGEG